MIDLSGLPRPTRLGTLALLAWALEWLALVWAAASGKLQMEIGKPKKTIIIHPLHEPVGRPTPVREPVRVKEPEKVKVPA